MFINRILKAISVVLGVGFIASLSLGHELEGSALSSMMLVFLTVLYFRGTKSKSKYFSSFLVIFTFAHVLSYLSWYLPEEDYFGTDYIYYLANILYVISYLFLILRFTSKFDIKLILKRFLFSILILLVLDVFCVIIVTETAGEVLSVYEYALEFLYNAVVMVLLSVALINYMYRNDNKSMLFLLACICIVFSEVIQLAYFYVLSSNDLGVIYSTFLVLAFALFYTQSQMKFLGPFEAYSEGPL